MNGYNLLRDWYNYKFSNPSKVKAIHSDMYCYLIDLWNRLGQKQEFGLPTMVTMEALGIGSYNTYKKTFHDLVEFGFIKLVADSKNQHQSRIVALSKFDKASDEATDKALDKAHIKATDIIDKQETNNKETNSKKFVPPTFNDVLEYCMQNNLEVDGYKFINFYESKGWMVGKNKMKDWKAAVRTWVKPKQEQVIDPLVEYVNKQLGL
jgi:hypothetical protein